MNETPLTTVEKLYKGVQLTRPLLRTITARVEADLTGTGVTVGQRAILEVLLAVTKATAPEITSILELKRQYVGRELQELHKDKMVIMTPNPRHKTSQYYSMTEKARDLIVKIRKRETETLTEFSRRFTPAEIDAYYRIQKTLNEEM